ncbi:hypothetical protein BGY98DRAFT_955459 [Russula aff. rugulosa BPL654]|nr:hypothetical protein BGY98DRAFT_955459 [Russula aff. rugulosa BPL654]
MRSSHNTPSIVQILALMLSATLSPTSNSTNSVGITEMAKVLLSFWLLTPLRWSMNETDRPLRCPPPSKRFAILATCLHLRLFLGRRLLRSLLPRPNQIVLSACSLL